MVTAKNNSEENLYIQSAKLNRRRYSKTYLRHEDIMKGGRIDYVMGSRPNTKRGTALTDAPFSMTTTDFAAPPYVAGGDAYFVDSTRVTLQCRTQDARIRYTLDGSDPSADSPLYTDPVSIDQTTTLKARAFAPGQDPSPVTSHRVEKAAFQSAAPVQDLVPGLKYDYFKGRFRSVTHLRTPVKSGTVKRVDLSMKDQDDNFGVIYHGYLAVPQDGMYTLYLTSDDGSQLFLGDKLIVDHDGPHGATTAQTRMALAQGKHKIQLKYYEGAADDTLTFEWSGPNLSKQIVPAKALFMAP